MSSRPLAAALFALVLAVGFARPIEVSAGRQWCHRDPIYAIDGKNVSIDVAVYEDQQKLVTGPIRVVIYVPQNVKVQVVYQDSGFNNYGEVASISRSSNLKQSKSFTPVRIEVTVPTKKGDIAVLVSMTPDGARTSTVNGRSNNSIGANLNVPR